MHARLMACLALLMIFTASTAAAQDAAALPRELDEMRKSFEAMKQSYEKSIDALGERIKRLEPAPAPSPAPFASATCS